MPDHRRKRAPICAHIALIYDSARDSCSNLVHGFSACSSSVSVTLVQMEIAVNSRSPDRENTRNGPDSFVAAPNRTTAVS
ncbi:hypothetical protein ZHAS_00020722 [Anopheles sinensis]|uniref:Uncharacterized protein n=1 Tax=Anopheles sinensis TaxID=74873 RepID=A0A084WQI5_ANOSI|nr:hypothetical protein ZHAS_00020722 [Anopheles sinensis]